MAPMRSWPLRLVVVTLAFTCAASDADHRRISCDPETESVKLSDTNCPNNDAWLSAFSRHGQRKKTIVVIGCNKGVDAVRLFAQYDTREKPYLLKTWQNALGEALPGNTGACGQVTSAEELSKPLWTTPLPEVYCVEPMPANVRLLTSLATSTHIPEHFHVLQYAVGLSHGSVLFPDAAAGTENLGVDIGGGNKAHVNASTVDSLFGHLDNIEMLLIDTEGNDALVILGAARVLQRVRYLEFENHSVGEWATFKLKTIIDFLDNLHFDCWWTTNTGILVRITHCWHNKYAGIKSWSNIACAKRNDAWWYDMDAIARG